EDVDSCEDALRQCIEMFGLCLNADRVQLWRIDMQQNGANASLKNEWVSDIGREYAQVNKNLFITFGSLPKWEQMFLNGESYNGPVASLPREEQELINSSGELKSVAIIPIFMQEQIWGLISIDDCVNERIFSNEEMDIIRSASLMMANAYHRVEHALEQQRIEIAEAKNREKSKFLARMSHEIRTPITAVIGISEIQLQKSGLSLDMKETFTRIHNSATLLLGIINDILDFTKIEAGRMGLRHDEYEVTSLINGITHLHVAYLGGKDIRFNLHVDENLPSYLIGDVIRIEQILNNLLSNAFKYTEKGSVDLQLSCIKNEETDKSIILQISITDTGVGMTEEQLAKIFDEFARFYEHGTHIASGTGLGMPIVQSLIHMLNAEIRLESAPGKGTNVVVRIPQAKSQKAEILGIKAARALQNLDTTHISSDRYKFAPEPMPYGRVLVVDDLEANTYVAKGLLEFYELDIDVCDSGYEAVNKIKQGNVYDIVLMDYMMPGQDGTETMKIMRSMGYTEPIVAFTANALIGKAEEFIKKGYDDFISKPIQAKHLNAVLTKYIRDKQSPEVLAAAKSATRTKKDNPDSVDLVKKLRLDFVKSHHKIFANIQSALEVADINTAHRLSHSLKSLAALIHEPVLSQMAKDIEDLFEKNEIPSSNQLALLEEELNRVLSCIGKTPEIRKKDFDVDKFSALFDELLPMLKSQNTASLDFVDELHKIPETAVLIRQIEEFKFNSALQTLETLRQVLNA
ncbi:MAG: ATP-binding protein, partial [Defluviitaleaceae bacterium]|nr:ATP-binding protein [Defluviitaleaceae bacterium]